MTRSHITAQREGLESRRVALEIIRAVDERRAFADALLGARIKKFTVRDRAFITRVVLGTTAWRARHDFELAAYGGYVLTLRDMARVVDGSELGFGVSLRTVVAGFGVFAATRSSGTSP